jgi:hypothetical protein
MATTTTNFGWDIPQSTDLVKDGATAIAALGQDIDTAFVDFKGGTTGQVLKKTSGTDLDVEWGTASSGLTLINTTSFSGVSSQSINDVFSTTYDNYKILIHLTTTGSSSTFQYRMRVAGADNTSSTYNDLNFRANGAGTSTTQNLNQNVGTLAITHSTAITKGISVDMFSPFLTAVTTFNATTGNMDNVNNQIGVYTAGGGHNTASSFTGITIFPSAGTFTGTISIYGYAK